MPELQSSRVVWRKSKRSSQATGDCVEVADLNGLVGIRDSKDPTGPVLLLQPIQWRALLSIGDIPKGETR